MKDCQACTRPSNNQSFNCPPIMADGRHFTDYRPRCDLNWVAPDGKMPNSYDYRMYLTRHAEALLRKEREETYAKNVCGPCKEPYHEGTMLPESSKMVCNAQTCHVKETDPRGLGMGRQYEGFRQDPSEMAFLSLKQKETDLFSKYANCCGPAEEVLNYYSVDASPSPSLNRPAMPGGGVPMTGGDTIRM